VYQPVITATTAAKLSLITVSVIQSMGNGKVVS